VIDQSNVLPNTLKIFNREVETLILNSTKETTDGNLKFLKIESAPLIENILDRLYEQKILSVFVEGGASTLSQFIESGFWDECRVITASKKLSSGLKAPTIKGKIVDHFDSGTDTIDIYINDTKLNEWNS
jgi:diaminohydroxyphosphoribosylaminopyrimidine deaminase/5-amino-6-(5-phosphoribosylamino)uracil reductase